MLTTAPANFLASDIWQENEGGVLEYLPSSLNRSLVIVAAIVAQEQEPTVIIPQYRSYQTRKYL